MVILITGAAGFIGSSLAHWLLENTEHEIIGIDNFSSGYRDNLPRHGRFTNWYIDVTNAQELERIFSIVNPDICYAFAAYAAEGRSNYIRSFIWHNNTVGTANTINCCVNHNCKIIFTSSVAVYSGEPPYTEETIPNPIDEYGLSKWASERSIQITGEQHGLDWCIIRPRNVYGIRQSLWDTARNVMGIFSYQALNNKPMTIFGDGLQVRNFTYIDDILEPLYNAIKVEKQIINLGSERQYKVIEAAQYIGYFANHENFIHLEARHEIKEATCNSEKAKQLLGFQDKTSLIKGIKKMWDWAVMQPNRELQTPPELEVIKGAHVSVLTAPKKEKNNYPHITTIGQKDAYLGK